MEVNVRLLRCLTAVIDEGHFGRAAERLYISAPALSQQIRRLERQVGVPLLDRSSHPVRSLPEAQEFVAAARAVLAETDRALAIAQALRRRGENRLRIGFVLTFAGRMTRPILDEFALAAPDIVVELVELGFADQVTAVLNGTVDVSFAVGPLDSNALLHTDVVLTEPRTLAMASTHPLATQASLHIAQVGASPQICVAPDQVTDGWFRWWSVDPRPDGSRPHYGPACHSAVDFLEIVGTGRGVGITAASLRDLFPRPGIAYVPIDDVEHVNNGRKLTPLRRVSSKACRNTPSNSRSVATSLRTHPSTRGQFSDDADRTFDDVPVFACRRPVGGCAATASRRDRCRRRPRISVTRPRAAVLTIR